MTCFTLSVLLFEFFNISSYIIASTKARYQQHCQQIFELQNKVLSSNEVLSSDSEWETDSEISDEEFDAVASRLEKMICEGTTLEEIEHQEEEKIRLDMKQSMLNKSNKSNRNVPKEEIRDLNYYKNKILKIERTFESDDGTEYVRYETVTNPVVMKAYDRIRSTKSSEFIKTIGSKTKKLKYERSERKNSLGSNEMKTFNGCKNDPKKNERVTSTRRKPGNNSILGDLSDDSCPTTTFTSTASKTASSKSSENEERQVHLNGIKLKFSKQVVEDAQKEADLEEDSEEDFEGMGKPDFKNVDYFASYPKGNNTQSRFRRLPASDQINELLDDIIVNIKINLKKMFGEKVAKCLDIINSRLKKAEKEEYKKAIDNPIGLGDMRVKTQLKKYKNREDFLEDVARLNVNTKKFFGVDTEEAACVDEMMQICFKELHLKEESLMLPEALQLAQVS